MVFPVQTHAAISRLTQVAQRMQLSRTHYKVVRRLLLQHEPHRSHEVDGVAPIASNFEVPKCKPPVSHDRLSALIEIKRIPDAQSCARCAVSNLLRNKMQRPTLTFVVKQDAAG